jgi:hypothetical protein
MGPYPALKTMDTGSFPGVKWPGRGVNKQPNLRVEVQERVELYLYFPVRSWQVIEWQVIE